MNLSPEVIDEVNKILYDIMKNQLPDLVAASCEISAIPGRRLDHIHLDGFLNGMTTATLLIQSGQLNITTLEIDRT